LRIAQRRADVVREGVASELLHEPFAHPRLLFLVSPELGVRQDHDGSEKRLNGLAIDRGDRADRAGRFGLSLKPRRAREEHDLVRADNMEAKPGRELGPASKDRSIRTEVAVPRPVQVAV
jgi:hypothetical protein